MCRHRAVRPWYRQSYKCRESRCVVARAESCGEGLAAVRCQIACRGADGQGRARGDVTGARAVAGRGDGRTACGVGEAVDVGWCSVPIYLNLFLYL